MTDEGEQAPPVPKLWLVDGFNVLHAALGSGSDREGWWRGGPRERLLERARRFDDPTAELVVVFDGAQPALPPDPGAPAPRVHVVFAPSADSWLLARLRSAPDPARVAVVTRDRRLAARVRSRGAQLVAPGAFLARCAAPDPPAS